jgi:hypothetical protein
MMHAVCCADVQDRLDEFHDGELPLDDRIAIQGHLRDCVTCALAASELEELRLSLREMALSLPDRSDPEAERLATNVTERVRVEAQFSWSAELRSLFQDMHLVWAALGATAATLVCLIGSISVMHATNQERPDSLAGLISYLANPGSNQNPVRLDNHMLVPRALIDAEAFLPMSANDNAVLALSAVVTREGRVQNIEFLNPAHAAAIKVRPDVLIAMLDAAARAEFEPAQAGGSPVAVSMVWLLASTTVRGQAEDVVLVRRPLSSMPEHPARPEPKVTSPAPVVVAARPSTDA